MCAYSLILYIKLAALLRHFRNSYISHNDTRRIPYHLCIINGRTYLMYEDNFYIEETHAYRLLISFANHNGFENTNNDHIKNVRSIHELHISNLIYILIIIASLLTARTYADSISSDISYINQNITDEQIKMYLNLSADIDKVNSENELIVALINWINKNSSFDYQIDEIPALVKVSQEVIMKLSVGIKMPASINQNSAEIKGLYNFNQKSIYILDNFDMNNEVDRAILVHEIVHFLQFEHGDNLFFDCNQKLEGFAYRLQARYLFSQGQDINFTGEHIRHASRCP